MGVIYYLLSPSSQTYRKSTEYGDNTTQYNEINRLQRFLTNMQIQENKVCQMHNRHAKGHRTKTSYDKMQQ